MAFDSDSGLWQEFLQVWPIDRLRAMRLDEYATSGDKNCFIYWLEFRLADYGSIAGGSAFKFGIYARKSNKVEAGDGSLAYDANYGWYRKLGDTPEAAFEVVRKHVVTVAEAARDGNLEAIDASPLGAVYKWKIAFHYQSQQQSLISCVYLRKPLLSFLQLPLSDMTRPQSSLYRDIAAQRWDDESIVALSRRVWEKWVYSSPYEIKLTDGAVKNGYLSVSLVAAPFPESMRGGETDADAGETARFRTDTGLEFETDVRAPGVTSSGRIRHRMHPYFSQINAQPGDSIFITPEAEGSYLISHKSVTGAVAATTPAVREPAPKPTENARMTKPPMNQILFGPPGTGKTYHSVNAALEVLDPDCLAANPGAAGRKALKQRFDELVQARRIRFITFHQSFSYEDFVEGLRADNDEDGNLRYRVEPGVFKSICDDARGAAQVASAVGIRDGARIWKISIEGTGASTTRDYGFKHGEARIGWGEVGDLHDERLAERPDYQALGSNDRNTLHAFSSEIQPGDVMLCIGSATQAQAIGVVQGDYQFEANVPSGVRADFNNVLPVRWLATGLALNLRELNGGIRFTLKTVYELSRFGWPELAEAIEAAGIELGGASRIPARQPLEHVLIIDEINRGNVSRIFGELITLIEPSKRAGADEQLEVVLPYSKKSFAVPANVHLIGTMNTADRSLAGLDIALRRRFEFVEMPARPGLLAGVVVDGIDIETMLTVMNQRIEVLLDRDHHLGHAYFMPLMADRSLTRLAAIFRNQILPLLQEYFFEDWERIHWVLNDQHKGAGHCFVVPPRHNVAGLFGGTAEVPVDARLWELDPAALVRRESYLGIIDANGG
ncbi:MAG: AAA family ATPase [Lysobacter sp.]